MSVGAAPSVRRPGTVFACRIASRLSASIVPEVEPDSPAQPPSYSPRPPAAPAPERLPSLPVVSSASPANTTSPPRAMGMSIRRFIGVFLQWSGRGLSWQASRQGGTRTNLPIPLRREPERALLKGACSHFSKRIQRPRTQEHTVKKL